MGCADYCIDMDADINNNFQCSTVVKKARKEYRCVECHQVIRPGDSYEKYVTKDINIETFRTCAICYDIRQALVCGSWYFGMLWEQIEESVFPNWQIDCMVKMQREDARLYIWERWREWKADQER